MEGETKTVICKHLHTEIREILNDFFNLHRRTFFKFIHKEYVSSYQPGDQIASVRVYEDAKSKYNELVKQYAQGKDTCVNSFNILASQSYIVKYFN